MKSVAANKDQQPERGPGRGGSAGGRRGGVGGGAAGQNANADNGQQLVDLIQNVICPKSWDVNGGACYDLLLAAAACDRRPRHR